MKGNIVARQGVDGVVQRIDRFQSLSPGTYWRVRDTAKLDDTFILGKVHLIKQLKYAGGQVHAVVILEHPGAKRPKSTYTYLVQDFLDSFEFEPDAMAVREQEIAEAQRLIQDKQQEIVRISADPGYVMGLLSHDGAAQQSEEAGQIDFEAGLPSPETGTQQIATVAKSDIHRLQAQLTNQRIIAQAQSNLLNLKTHELQEAVLALTPYFSERGAAAMASASEAITYVKKIEEGLATLGLYTGEGVEVIRHYQGRSANKTEPLTLRQRKLYLDEESLISAAEGGADFQNLDEFLRQLHTCPDTLQRVLPEPRGIVAFQYRRKDKDYGKPSSLTDAYQNAGKNAINMTAFLLIRDGENLTTVHSPLEHMTRLFPTKDDTGKPFRGIDGKNITVDDVNYADAKERSAQITLHFKRILILLWGLYDREENIFGPLAVEDTFGGHVNLLSGAVHKELFHFIYDDEPDTLLGEARPSFREWVAAHNRLIQSGSQVYCRWDALLDEEHAPACAKERLDRDYYRDEVRYRPKGEGDMAIVQTQGEEFIVKETVYSTDRFYFKKQPFQATFYLKPSSWFSSFAYLCLDNVDPDDIDWYINDRANRQNYLQTIPLLVGIRDHLRQERSAREAFVDAVMDALRQGGFTGEERSLRQSVYDAVRMWRAANRGKVVPAPGDKDYRKSLNTILNQLWWLNRDSFVQCLQHIEALCQREGRQPLRLVISGKGYVALYASANETERDTRLGPHVWVKRMVLGLNKQSVRVERFTWQQIKEFVSSERVLHVWDEEACARYAAHRPRLYEYETLGKSFDLVRRGRQSLLALLRGDEPERFVYFNDYINRFNHNHNDGYVHVPYITFPLGLAKVRTDEKEVQRYGIILLSARLDYFSYWACHREARDQLTSWIHRTYSDPTATLRNLRGQKWLKYRLEIAIVSTRTVDQFKDNNYYLSRDKNEDMSYFNLYSNGPCLSDARESMTGNGTYPSSFGFRKVDTFRREKAPSIETIDWFDDESEEQVDSLLTVNFGASQ